MSFPRRPRSIASAVHCSGVKSSSSPKKGVLADVAGLDKVIKAVPGRQPPTEALRHRVETLGVLFVMSLDVGDQVLQRLRQRTTGDVGQRGQQFGSPTPAGTSRLGLSERSSEIFHSALGKGWLR